MVYQRDYDKLDGAFAIKMRPLLLVAVVNLRLAQVMKDLYVLITYLFSCLYSFVSSILSICCFSSFRARSFFLLHADHETITFFILKGI